VMVMVTVTVTVKLTDISKGRKGVSDQRDNHTLVFLPHR
jgi:hypothetical protein